MLCLLFLGGTTVLADEFTNISAYDLYAGGYITSTQKHYTTYRVAANVTVGACIKIGSYGTEVNVGYNGYSHIESSHKVSPYYSHAHSKNIF